MTPTFAQTLKLKDVYPDKSRYAPGETVTVQAELSGSPTGQVLSAVVTDLDHVVGKCGPVTVDAHTTSPVALPCTVPSTDFRGYLVTAELQDVGDALISRRETAIDVSSDWKIYPRYGYLAHYNRKEGARPEQWLDTLNRYHINGLEFYDFQYRHDKPLAGTVEHPASAWKDIAGRTIVAGIVSGFIEQAHAHNMMAMAYNASYSAYEDVFKGARPFPLQWATWTTADGPRTALAAKNLPMHIAGGVTSKLFYMNQNSDGWQNYLFGKMHELFEAYPFDGWHIDTFGDKGGYAYDRSPVDYVDGFKGFIDHASAKLHTRILFNAVGTWGQEKIATSAADFVYSELWEDHETFSSILASTEQVRLANPDKAYVIAAYLHRNESKDGPKPSSHEFNPPSVLLTDAAIFASGASHIELGDGDRMLSNEYFPADSKLIVSASLHETLRQYYDFITAYEFYLRNGLKPADVGVAIEGKAVDSLGLPNTIWSIARQRNGFTVIHLINLLGSDDPHWRDIMVNRPEAPRLTNLRVRLTLPGRIRSLGWASPDAEGGRFQPLPFQKHQTGAGEQIDLILPSIHYWDALFIGTE